MATKAKNKTRVGTQVTYQPNGQDFETRPKNEARPAIITDEYKHSKSGCGENGVDGTITYDAVTLTVFHSEGSGTLVRKNIPHKDDAGEGESYWE